VQRSGSIDNIVNITTTRGIGRMNERRTPVGRGSGRKKRKKRECSRNKTRGPYLSSSWGKGLGKWSARPGGGDMLGMESEFAQGDKSLVPKPAAENETMGRRKNRWG